MRLGFLSLSYHAKLLFSTSLYPLRGNEEYTCLLHAWLGTKDMPPHLHPDPCHWGQRRSVTKLSISLFCTHTQTSWVLRNGEMSKNAIGTEGSCVFRWGCKAGNGETEKNHMSTWVTSLNSFLCIDTDMFPHSDGFSWGSSWAYPTNFYHNRYCPHHLCNLRASPIVEGFSFHFWRYVYMTTMF